MPESRKELRKSIRSYTNLMRKIISSSRGKLNGYIRCLDCDIIYLNRMANWLRR